MIHTLFPTSVYVVDDLISNELIEKYQNIILNTSCDSGGNNWLTDVRNSLGTFNLKESFEFTPLIEKVTEKIYELNTLMGSNHQYCCNYSWFNIYEKGDYQEYHNHPGNTYSAVYFLKSNSKSSPLIIANPSESFDMLPIIGVQNFNKFNFATYKFEPKQNRLIIFRSYIKHMVPKHLDEEKRITIAFNF